MAYEISIGSNVRKSPYFDACVEDGVKVFSIYNHMYMPDHFGNPRGEYHSLLNGVVMWDVAGERQVEISGPDAEKLAQYLTPRNIAGTKVGQGRYVPLCDPSGQVINDPVLLKLSATRFWLSVADSDIHLWATAIAHELGWDVTVSEPDVSPLAIQGPKALDVAVALFGEWVRELRHFWFQKTDLNGIPLILARSGWSKQGGFELYLMDGSRGYELWQLVKQAGEPFHIRPGAPNGQERVESGLMSYGADFRVQTRAANPYELGFEGMVDLDGHDFIGRDALRKIALSPPNRRWTGFLLDTEPLTPPGHPVDVMQGGAYVGYVSEVVFSPRLKRNIAIGMVRTEIDEDAQDLTVVLPSGPKATQTCALPFIK